MEKYKVATVKYNATAHQSTLKLTDNDGHYLGYVQILDEIKNAKEVEIK